MYIPGALFSTDLFWTIIKWLMILVIWGIFAWGTWKEDRKIRGLLKGKIDERHAMGILRVLHRRDMQIWLQVSLLLIIVAVNDIHHDADLLPTDFFVAPVPVMTPEVKESPDDNYDKVLKKNATSSALPFSNITEFNERNGKREAYIDWLKERYEGWLVTYYYLQKCKKTTPDDYDFIHRSLAKDLESAHAGKDVEQNILVAANGSYKEMYSDISCDSAHLTSTKSMFDANMQQAKQALVNGANTEPPASAKTGNSR